MTEEASFDQSDALALIAQAAASASSLSEGARQGAHTVEQLAGAVGATRDQLAAAVHDARQAADRLRQQVEELHATSDREIQSFVAALATARTQMVGLAPAIADTLARLEASLSAVDAEQAATLERLDHDARRLEAAQQALLSQGASLLAGVEHAQQAAETELRTAWRQVADHKDRLEEARARAVEAYVSRQALLDARLHLVEASLVTLERAVLDAVSGFEELVARERDEVAGRLMQTFGVDLGEALGSLSASLSSALDEMRVVGERPRAIAEAQVVSLTQKLHASLPALFQIDAIFQKARRMEITDFANDLSSPRGQ